MQALTSQKTFSIFRNLNVLFCFVLFRFVIAGFFQKCKFTLSYQDQTELDWNISYSYKICFLEVESFQVMGW